MDFLKTCLRKYQEAGWAVSLRTERYDELNVRTVLVFDDVKDPRRQASRPLDHLPRWLPVPVVHKRRPGGQHAVAPPAPRLNVKDRHSPGSPVEVNRAGPPARRSHPTTPSTGTQRGARSGLPGYGWAAQPQLRMAAQATIEATITARAMAPMAAARIHAIQSTDASLECCVVVSIAPNLRAAGCDGVGEIPRSRLRAGQPVGIELIDLRGEALGARAPPQLEGGRDLARIL